MNFINKLRTFMIGRYGIDELYKFLFSIYLILFLGNLFIKSSIITIIEFLIIIIILGRFFSKNLYARSKENQVFLKFKKKIMHPFTNIKRNIKDKNHIYKTCNKCKTTLKLPVPEKRGIKHAKCPSCGKKIKILVLKKEKIEVILNNKKEDKSGKNNKY